MYIFMMFHKTLENDGNLVLLRQRLLVELSYPGRSLSKANLLGYMEHVIGIKVLYVHVCIQQ